MNLLTTKATDHLSKMQPRKDEDTSHTGSRGSGFRYTPKYRFCRWDGAVIALVVVLSAVIALLLFQGASSSITATSHLEAVLTVSGEEVWRTSLSELSAPKTHKVTVAAGSLTVLEEAGKVCVQSSDCPDQICVRTGWLSFAGQTAVCLPLKVVLKVISVDSKGAAAQDTSTIYDAISK